MYLMTHLRNVGARLREHFRQGFDWLMGNVYDVSHDRDRMSKCLTCSIQFGL